MRFKLLILITVMTLLATFLTFFHSNASARPQTLQEPISQTGIGAEVGAVPTVIAIPQIPVESIPPSTSPDYGMDLDFFVQSVINGAPGQVVGVYVPETLALPIAQQPQENNNFVSTEPNVITQFRAAERFHTVGLLAHNYLAGERFYGIRQAQTVVLIYGDGSLRYYQVSEIQKFQALTPSSPQSDFIDLSDPTSRRITAGDVFNRVYTQGDRVVFQTCILNNGDSSWGRMFIIATPMTTAPTSFLAPALTSLPRVF
jgi:hypothetical protein